MRKEGVFAASFCWLKTRGSKKKIPKKVLMNE